MGNQMNYAEYLEHYGVKGMRWGIRRTLEQLGHRKPFRRKSYEGPEQSDSRPIRGAKIINKEQWLLKRRERVEKRAEKKAREDIARREKILQNPTLLYKHRKEFSSEEIRKAMSNIQMEQNLQQLSMNQLSAGATYINAALKYAEAGIKVYNNAAKMYNAFNKQNKKAPIIGQGKDKKKDKNKDKDDDD